MRSQLWTEDDARHYDNNHDGKFDQAILGPTVDFLSALAADAAVGHNPQALELAIGTGRVAVPLHSRGVRVAAELRRLPPGQGVVPCVLADDHLNLDTIDTVSQRLTSHHFRRFENGTWSRSASEHRYIWPAELDLMARIGGMEFVCRVADWDGSVFDETSGSAVSVWRRIGPPR